MQTSDSLHTWRVSFVIAAAIALLPIAAGAVIYRSPIPRPSAQAAPQPGGFRRALATRAGRVVVVASLMAGAAGFPFNTFLTATAIDELGISSLRTAGIWWVIGIMGVGAGPIFGRYGDRASPLRALLAGALSYASGLIVLMLLWNPLGLVVAAIGYPFMNYPIWGLVGSLANNEFDTGIAVRTISLGLVAASLGGAASNALIGAWIEASTSFRGPVVAMAVAVAAVVAWYGLLVRSGGLEDPDSAGRWPRRSGVG